MEKTVMDAQRPTDAQSPWKIGANYFIRTVTNYYTGRLVQVTPHELVLEEVAWIADAGRWSIMLREGVTSPQVHTAVEPYPAGQVLIGRGALVDATCIVWPLPRA
mgnify:FL=1